MPNCKLKSPYSAPYQTRRVKKRQNGEWELKTICTTHLGFLGYKPSKLACEQALRGDLAVGWEKEGELAKFLFQFKKSKDYCKADLKQRILFFITIFRLAIPAFFRFTDVTELM